jgi:hypothetical protein
VPLATFIQKEEEGCTDNISQKFMEVRGLSSQFRLLHGIYDHGSRAGRKEHWVLRILDGDLDLAQLIKTSQSTLRQSCTIIRMDSIKLLMRGSGAVCAKT